MKAKSYFHEKNGPKHFMLLQKQYFTQFSSFKVLSFPKKTCQTRFFRSFRISVFSLVPSPSGMLNRSIKFRGKSVTFLHNDKWPLEKAIKIILSSLIEVYYYVVINWHKTKKHIS